MRERHLRSLLGSTPPITTGTGPISPASNDRPAKAANSARR